MLVQERQDLVELRVLRGEVRSSPRFPALIRSLVLSPWLSILNMTMELLHASTWSFRIFHDSTISTMPTA
jgi:hypothetical protein